MARLGSRSFGRFPGASGVRRRAHSPASCSGPCGRSAAPGATSPGLAEAAEGTGAGLAVSTVVEGGGGTGFPIFSR